MKHLWRDVQQHPVGALLFLAIWVGLWSWVAIGARLGGDMDVAVVVAHPLVPFVAALLIGRWRWRPEDPDAAVFTALAVGTVICLIAVAILMARPWYDALTGHEDPSHGRVAEFTIGGLLSVGWLAAYVGQFLGSALARMRWGRGAQAPSRGR